MTSVSGQLLTGRLHDVIRPNCAFAGSLLWRAGELFADARLLDLTTTRPLIGEIAVLSFVSGKVQP